MKDKAIIELIVVMIIVAYGLWLLKESAAPMVNENPVDGQEEVAPN